MHVDAASKLIRNLFFGDMAIFSKKKDKEQERPCLYKEIRVTSRR